MSSEAVPREPDILDSFSKVQIDPIFVSVFKKMRMYNDLLSSQMVSDEQIEEIMNELDDEWGMVLRDKVEVTGVVSFLPPEVEGSEGESIRDFYEAHEMEFGGVLPVRVGAGNEYDDSNVLTEDLHNYVLKVRFVREGIATDGSLVTMYGTADVDEISSIVVPNMMSVPGAREWLDFYHPEYMQDIDVALLNPAVEECDMVMRLQDVSIDVKLPRDEDEQRIVRSMQALNIYTNSLFDFDQDAPYLLAVSGDAWQLGDGNLEPAHISGSTMAALDRIVWLAEEGQPENILIPHLSARFLAESKDEPATDMFVPLKSVVALRSFRHDYFIGYPEEE